MVTMRVVMGVMVVVVTLGSGSIPEEESPEYT